MPTKNHGRMAQDMKREIIAIIGEMKDPRVTGGLLTVTRLDVTPDLDQAKVYISVMGREGGPEPVVKALNKPSGHVRTEVSRRMHIRKAPRFVFVKDEGAAYAAHINQLLGELDITPTLISSVERAAQDNLGITAVIAAFAIEALTGAGAAQTYLVGESQLLHQPEFRDPDKAHRLMSYLSDGSNLLEIPMEQLGGENEVRVLIGPENVAEELRDSSVVLATYDAGENMRGLIGVVGPTRMDYSKVAAKLSFIAAGLSKLLGGGTLPPPGLDNKLIIKGDDSDEHENK